MKRSGFTIIEIIIVMAITSALIAVSFSSLYTTMKKAEIESTISNVAEGVINLLQESRMESAKKEIYIEVNYETDQNRLSYTTDSNAKYYQLPKQYELVPEQISDGIPFSGTPNQTGFYLGYFVEEDTDSMEIKDAYTFLIQSLDKNDITREVRIDKGMPFIVG